MSDTSFNVTNHLKEIFDKTVRTFLTGRKTTTLKEIEESFEKSLADLSVLGKFPAHRIPLVSAIERPMIHNDRCIDLEFFDRTTGELITNINQYLSYTPGVNTFRGCDVVITIDGKPIKGIDSDTVVMTFPEMAEKIELQKTLKSVYKPTQEA